LAAAHIRVNSVHPGLVDTQMMEFVETQVGAPSSAAARAAFTDFVRCGVTRSLRKSPTSSGFY